MNIHISSESLTTNAGFFKSYIISKENRKEPKLPFQLFKIGKHDIINEEFMTLTSDCLRTD